MKKKHIFSSDLFKNNDFFQIFKTDDDLNYLAKCVKQLFSKTHLDASVSAKNTIFCDFTKVESLLKMSCFIEKESEKFI
jgi:hypothetical protein